MPISVWLLGQSGSGLDSHKAATYWKLVHKTQDATMEDVMTLFFSRPRSGGRYFNNCGLDPVWEVDAPSATYEEATKEAQAQRVDEFHYHFDPPPPPQTRRSEAEAAEAAHDEADEADRRTHFIDTEGLQHHLEGPGSHHFLLEGQEVDEEEEDDFAMRRRTRRRLDTDFIEDEATEE